MKKIFSLLLIAVCLFLSFGAVAAYAQTKCDPNKGYCPLEPLPGLENASGVNFAQFLGLIFNLLLIAGALVAVVMIVVAGIGYIISGAGVEISEAKKRMWAAVYGLIILLGAWLLLYTVNPALLNFDLSSIGRAGGGPNTSGGGTGGTGDEIGNTTDDSAITDITISGWNGTATVYTTGSLVPPREMLKKYDDVCKQKGLTFKATSEKGSDDVGSYTVWKCQ